MELRQFIDNFVRSASGPYYSLACLRPRGYKSDIPGHLLQCGQGLHVGFWDDLAWNETFRPSAHFAAGAQQNVAPRKPQFAIKSL
jgi:hypothetical protein